MPAMKFRSRSSGKATAFYNDFGECRGINKIVSGDRDNLHHAFAQS